MSSEFKVGDKVRCLRDLDGQFTEGKIYTVREDSRRGDRFSLCRVKHDDKGEQNGWGVYHFELVLEESKVENLVNSANAGFAALRKLADMGIEVECTENAARGAWDKECNLRNWQVRLNPATPVFQEFKVGGLTVWMKENRLHVGCVGVVATEAVKVLRDLLNSGNGAHHLGQYRLLPNRKGISVYSASDVATILWDDAHKIYDALVKAGVV